MPPKFSPGLRLLLISSVENEVLPPALRDIEFADAALQSVFYFMQRELLRVLRFSEGLWGASRTEATYEFLLADYGPSKNFHALLDYTAANLTDMNEFGLDPGIALDPVLSELLMDSSPSRAVRHCHLSTLLAMGFSVSCLSALKSGYVEDAAWAYGEMRYRAGLAFAYADFAPSDDNAAEVAKVLRVMEAIKEGGVRGGQRSTATRRRTAIDPLAVRVEATAAGWPLKTDGVLKRLALRFKCTPERIGQILKSK